MDSSTIRWLIAGLFIGFVTVVVMRDLLGRKRPRSIKPKQQGFRRAKPTTPAAPTRSWKAGSRR